MKYRSDIDGLRALAVMPVVLFHAGFSTFSGGFVGVDVFFVISGYLITRILLDEIRQGKFSIIYFYERRARRILPALFVVLAFTSVGTYFLYFASDFVSYAKSVLSTLGFGSNILFWVEIGDYFDAGTHTKPLLHTWSLAVEEQFYIFFPLFLMLMHRFIPKAFKTLFWCAFVGSFIVSVYGVFNHPKATFYLLPTRAWELLFGSLAAAGYIALPHNQKIREVASAAGMLLIIASIFLLSERSPFPGHNAFYPCLGAALIIIAGQDGFKTAAGRILSIKPIVFIGLISYSLYLWHWPVIVFLKVMNIGELSVLQQWGAVLGSIVLAIVTWRFVERPFRGKASSFSRKQIFVYSSVVTLVFVGCAWVGAFQEDMLDRFDSKTQYLISFKKSKYESPSYCRNDSKNNSDIPCLYGAKGKKPDMALWGDSHSRILVPAIEDIYESSNKSFLHYSYSGCVPLIDLASNINYAKKCLDYNKWALELLINDRDIKVVVLAARWSTYTKGTTWAAGPAEKKLEMEYPQEVLEQNFTPSFNKTVSALLAANKKVVLVYPIPEIGYNVPNTLARRYLVNKLAPETFTSPFSYYKKRQDFVFKTFDAFNHPNLLKVYPHKKLCDDKECIVYKDGNVLYHDDDHLSLEGAEYIKELFVEALKE